MTKPVPQSIKDKIQKCTDTYLNAIMEAPMKSGWNRAFGMRVPSISDLTREYNARIRAYNEHLVDHGYASILTEEKVESVKVNL